MGFGGSKCVGGVCVGMVSDTAYLVQTGVQNISESGTAVAVATDWLGGVVDEVDVVEASAGESGPGEMEVQFVLRLTEADVERVEGSDEFQLLGEL